MALNIFEPRYRLMVRRCMEGARRFGMATVGPSHALHEVACECEILECQPQPDGCAQRHSIVDLPFLHCLPKLITHFTPSYGNSWQLGLKPACSAVSSFWIDLLQAYAKVKTYAFCYNTTSTKHTLNMDL